MPQRGLAMELAKDVATGAMDTLLHKLGDLLVKEHNLPTSVKQGIRDIKAELESMEAALVKVSEVPLDQLDPQVKIWANEVRELSYAIEDSLDDSMARSDGLQPTKHNIIMGLLKMARDEFIKLKARRKIANDIKDIEIQVSKVKERRDRYKVDDVVANLATTTVDPRLSAMYSKVSDLVGIDKAMDELMKRLSEGDDVCQQKLKIVSVVGFGGLGKTTLAKAVYDTLKKKFDCGCFVPVGRNPDKKKVLRDILYELDKKRYTNITGSKMDERQLIDELREFLVDKRYLIVIDDVWDIPTWDMIKCGLVDNNPKNRIITTTRNCEVAKKIGGVYNIKPLSDYNSKKLFNSRIFGGEGISHDDQSAEVSDKFLRKCGGVPLSIITIASLLVSKPMGEWSKVFDSIGFGHEDNEAVQNTRKILSFSYYDLSFHLKACLLHLSVYPEDCYIRKRWAIWKWVAEGLIPHKQGIGSFELGESYFNELINKSMIVGISRPNFISGCDGCYVHDLVLDLIRNISNEVNFVTTQDVVQHNTCSPSTSRSARRLAIRAGSMEHMDMRHLRSFNSIRPFDGGVMPPLLSFKVLRVLVLENCNFSGVGCRLEHIGKLVQLRYLGLVGTPVAELPSEIGHLKFLQTLAVDGTGLKELPPSVGELNKLMCLCASKGTRMMAGIGKLTALEELHLHSVDECPNFTTELGKLTKMRVLNICFDEMNESAQKALMESLGNLHRIQSLDISCDDPEEGVHFGGCEEWTPSSQLRRLILPDMIIPRRPSWIDPSRVPHLSCLWLKLEVVEARDMQILGRLPSLRDLTITTIQEDSYTQYTVGSGEFLNLRYLFTYIDIRCRSSEEGALPILEVLVCGASVGHDVGLVGNMPLLEEVIYWIHHCEDYSGEEVEATLAELRYAARTHPNAPNLKIRRSDDKYQIDDDDEEAQLHLVDKCPSLVNELEKLTKVRVLKLSVDEMEESAQKGLVECLSSLRRIHSLEIDSVAAEKPVHFVGWEDWRPPAPLRHLELSNIVIPRRPSWMDSSRVPHLSLLSWEVEVLEARDLRILGRLPSLCFLRIFIQEDNKHLSYTVGSHEFMKLGYLNLNIEIRCGEGALPMLEQLNCVARVGEDVGLVPGNMPLLRKVYYWLNWYGRSAGEVEEAEAALRHAAETHPNCPTLQIKRYYYESGDDRANKRRRLES